MSSRKRLTFIKDFINNESVCHFMVVQLFKLSTKDELQLVSNTPQYSRIGSINEKYIVSSARRDSLKLSERKTLSLLIALVHISSI